MKISPVSGQGLAIGSISAGAENGQAQPLPSVRSLRMNTNATPGYEAPQAQVGGPKGEGAQPALAIPDDNGTPAGEETKPLSPQFAALAKQKRALQVKERELADREKALSNQSPTQGGGIDTARLKSEPLKVLLENGVTYEQLTQAILENSDGDSERVVDAKLEALKESFEKKLTDRDQQTVQQYLARETKAAEKLIAEGDEFEVVRELGAIDQVPALIKAVYEAEGIAMTAREALEELEAVGIEKVEEDAARLARIKKVQEKLAASAPQAQPMQRPGMRTLTNRDTAQVPMSRKQRALAAFRGELKK